jgi:hypothetical protein
MMEQLCWKSLEHANHRVDAKRQGIVNQIKLLQAAELSVQAALPWQNFYHRRL